MNKGDLSERLWKACLVSSFEEAEAISEALLEEGDRGDLNADLIGYFGLTEAEARQIVGDASGDAIESSDVDDDVTEEGGPPLDDSDNGDGELIGEGECELCERYIRLSRHHLIPKSTWSRLECRLENAAEALRKDDEIKARLILGEGLEHLISELQHAVDRAGIRKLLSRTCNICRPCHSAVHRSHNNLTLAQRFSTVELLLKDEKIYSFCKWASRQKVGRYAR